MMLVGNIQFMKYPEIVPFAILKRFDGSNLIFSHLGHSLYFSCERWFVNLSAPKYRERGLAGEGTAINTDKLTGQMIQGRPNIVNGFSGKDADFARNRIDSRHKPKIQALMAWLRIWLEIQLTRIAVNESIPRDF